MASIIPGSTLLDLGDVQLEEVVQPCQEFLSVEKPQLVARSMPFREHCRLGGGGSGGPGFTHGGVVMAGAEKSRGNGEKGRGRGGRR